MSEQGEIPGQGKLGDEGAGPADDEDQADEPDELEHGGES
jgi:hypothetical protein